MPKVYDCFTFFNELDLLEIRLNVLNDVVDKFVLCEMAYTFQRKPKTLIFEENKDRFEKFKDKIIHVKLTEIPEPIESKLCTNGSTWQLECYQRDGIIKGLVDAADDDIIMLSDVDEIPDPKKVEDYIKYGNGISVFEQKMMYYFLNNINVTDPVWENGTRIAKFKDLKNPEDVPVRDKVFWEYSQKGSCNYFRYCLGTRIKNAGWHFSYLGGPEAIILKRSSFSETNFNTQKNMSKSDILHKIYVGKDILDRKEFCYKPLRINNDFPKFVRDNQERFSNLILKQTILQKIENYFVIFKCHNYLREKELKNKRNIFIKNMRKKLSPYKKKILKLLKISI